MQLHIALSAAVIFSGIASCLPTQLPNQPEFLNLAEASLGSELYKKSEDAGWLLAVLPKDEVEEFGSDQTLEKRDGDESGIAPKVFIVSMFTPEETIWHGIPAFNLLAHNITIPGLSPIFPEVHCTSDYAICQVVTGEGEINAASTMTALTLSPVFDLRKTYFLIAGIAGINPKIGTLGSVTLHRYEVQVALQYEFDPRELPANFSTGYIPQGAFESDQYPGQIYGTEVFELNAALRDEAISLVNQANVTLNDTAAAAKYRALYAPEPGNTFHVATQGPTVLACDGATSDVFFSGAILGSVFENFTHIMTNGSGEYCSTAQEDNATLEALLRSSATNKTDFSRIMVMRTASDFERPPPGVSAYDNLLYENQDITPSLQNILIAGLPIVQGIIAGWDTKFAAGINATNYAGDILGTLAGTRDIGLPSVTDGTVLKRSNAGAGARFGKRALRA